MSAFRTIFFEPTRIDINMDAVCALQLDGQRIIVRFTFKEDDTDEIYFKSEEEAKEAYLHLIS